MRNLKTKGFTLVELIVVIVILGILAVVVIPAFSSYSTKANEATCATTRRTLLGELSAEQIFHEDKTLKEISENVAEGQAFLAKTKCPSGGTITVSANEIYCSKHGKTISEKGLMEAFQKVIKKITDKTQSNNDMYRKTLYEQFPNGWPAIVLNGKVHYMQPFYNSKNGENYIYANADKENKKNWSAKAIYDEKENVWYVADYDKNSKDAITLTGFTPEEAVEEAKRKNWIKVEL